MQCPDCSAELWGKQYVGGAPEAYDGVSEWTCSACTYRRGRWSGRRLEGNEVEPRWGYNHKPLTFNQARPD